MRPSETKSDSGPARRLMRPLAIAATLLLLRVCPPLLAQATLAPPTQDYVLHFLGRQTAEAPVLPALLLGSEFTFEAWIWVDRADPSAFVLGTVDSTGDPIVEGDAYNWNALRISDDGRRIAFNQSSGPSSASGAATVTANSDLPLRTWVHVAGTLGSGVASLYVNGVLAGTGPSHGPPPVAASPFYLGALEGLDGYPSRFANSFVGALRQVRVWRRALTGQELQAQATKYLTGTEPGLVAYWPLDDGSGRAARDVSRNNATLAFPQTGPYTPLDQPGWWLVGDGGPFFVLDKVDLPQSLMDITKPNPPGIFDFIPIDFNSDGYPDVVTVGSGPLYALKNDGHGNLLDVTSSVLGTASMLDPSHCRVADFDGDGRSDLVVGEGNEMGETAPQSRIFIQTPDGRLEDQTTSRLPLKIAFAHNVAVGDADGDGRPDVFMCNVWGDGPELYMNDGSGHFSVGTGRLPAELAYDPNDYTYYCRARFTAASFADVRHTGKMDLLLGYGGCPLPPGDERLLLNDGQGHFTYAPGTPLPPRHGGYTWFTEDIVTADFDGDGWPDFLLSMMDCCENTFLELLLNNHDGTFRDASDRIPQNWRVGTAYAGFKWVITTDLNGDGWPDIIATGTPGLHILLNDHGQRFVDVSAIVPFGPTINHVHPVDLRRTGAPDLLMFDGYSYYVARNIKPFTGAVPAPPAAARRRRAAAHGP